MRKFILLLAIPILASRVSHAQSPGAGTSQAAQLDSSIVISMPDSTIVQSFQSSGVPRFRIQGINQLFEQSASLLLPRLSPLPVFLLCIVNKNGVNEKLRFVKK